MEEEELSSNESPTEIHIDLPHAPEVNPEVYRDVESLLFRGFITLPGEINKVTFIFKSLNHHEYGMLQLMSGIRDGAEVKEQFYNQFLAYGVFLVDGENVLENRREYIPMLCRTFSDFPMTAKAKMVRYLSEVNARAMRAIQMTEAYVMESYSRYRWAQLKGLDLMIPTVTGVPGTEHLGLNWGQLIWRALNHYEDMRETAEREWDNAKFIGSCMAGKGVQKIYNQDKERRRKEQEERIVRKDKVLRRARFGEKDEDQQEGKVLRVHARTLEELTKQLESDLRGEKDWHDQVVEAEERRIRESIQARQREMQKMVEQREQQQSRMAPSAYSDLKGMTQEELAQHLARKRQIEAQKANSRIVYPEMHDPRMEHFMEKYLNESDSSYQSGGVKTTIGTTDRNPNEAQPVEPSHPRGKPFRR